jgi:hypothetical protein
MAFPSGKTIRSLSNAYERAQSVAQRVKAEAADVRASAAAGTLQRYRALAFMTQLTDDLVTLAESASHPGIVAYAQEQEASAGLDIATEFNGMVAAITNARNWISTNYPKASGYVQVYTIDVNHRFADPGFTAQTVAGLLPFLDAITTSIAD